MIFPEQIEITVASRESLPTFQGQVFLFSGSYSLKLNTYKFLLIFFSELILCYRNKNKDSWRITRTGLGVKRSKLLQ